jgi:hypothetical protein
MADPKVRTLTQLEKNAATARVLNLRAIYQRNGESPDYKNQPLFQNTQINRSIIVKHRLRDNERDDFSQPKNTATKIIIPIDPGNLNSGGQYAFVGQNNFAEILSNTLNINPNKLKDDVEILYIIDQAPSLDPFLLREHLSRQGVKPAPCYFEISEMDTNKMLLFTQSEIEPLVSKSAGKDDKAGFAGVLARKLLADAADDMLNPLRETLQMTKHEFREGVFCWKAFLYYKWQLQTLLPTLPIVARQIAKIVPNGIVDPFTENQITMLRKSLRRQIISVVQHAQDTISIYDRAYGSLTEMNNPKPFRRFLINSPELFNPLGERLAAIDHVVSYWSHRFSLSRPGNVMADELIDIFMDFDQSLSVDAILD